MPRRQKNAVPQLGPIPPAGSAASALSRRLLLTSAASLGAAALVPPLAAAQSTGSLPAFTTPTGPVDSVAKDESYWQRVAAYYRVSRNFTNLEAGFWGMMAAPVFAQYQRNLERVNSESSWYARGQFLRDAEAARARAAALVGADVSEVAFTRNATEALQALISGYNRLKPGDAVLFADLDYPSMQYVMNWLVDRRGVRVVRVAIPEPATPASVLSTYSEALNANPQIRLVLLTHISNKTGLLVPTAKIAAMAREKGADVIVDAAHSLGQTTVTVPEIGADFIGFNLHKWIGAPLGVGLAYIRKSRLSDIDRMMADEDNPPDSVLSRVHTGTMNFASVMTVPDAIDFHTKVGPAYKAARLRYLRDRWVSQVRGIPNLDVLAPDDTGLSAAIASFRFRGRTSKEENDAVVAELFNKYALFTVRRTGIERGDCVRVTPALYNTPADVDRLARALAEMARRSG